MFNVPQFNASQFAEASQANLEKSLRLSQIALSSVERLVALQLGVARDLLSEHAQTTKALAEVKDVQGLVDLQRQLAQPTVDKTLDVARSVFDAASATQHELSKLLEEQVLTFNKNLISTLDQAIEAAPNGAGAAVTVLRNAVESAASTYDNVAKTTQKLASDFAKAAVTGAEQTAKAAVRRKAA
ncbi:hypothetical protein GCM10007860_10380 [Chitiniphilus shinanonensis]|uniref:Phasin domain-containing protein n=1 Tax=Chitiniphilus shinanonensis TaxID=553088 RepID=A0ABQ6BPK5_9NEIS|nr:phasin family protein [Chitiniphilus shinanonensis]GLS03893.1 hypothetical protein GCM10007860_10380 [Chitiniphilus shinanonensis]